LHRFNSGIAVLEIDDRQPELSGDGLGNMPFLEKSQSHEPFTQSTVPILLLEADSFLKLNWGERGSLKKDGTKLGPESSA
jgi:hypothetical protein